MMVVVQAQPLIFELDDVLPARVEAAQLCFSQLSGDRVTGSEQLTDERLQMYHLHPDLSYLLEKVDSIPSLVASPASRPSIDLVTLGR